MNNLQVNSMIMDDATAVRTCLERFLGAWEQGGDTLEDCLVNEPIVHMSPFGTCFSRTSASRWLANRAAGTSLTLSVVNHAVRVQGGRAVQYATVIGLVKTAGAYARHLAFGGSFVNDLVRTADGWRIAALRFDLQCEDSVSDTHLTREGLSYRGSGYGTKALIAGWKGVDDRIGHNMDPVPGSGAMVVNPEFDAPWYALKDAAAPASDEDQLKELLLRYCFATDFATFYLVRNDFTEDAVLELEGEHMEGRRSIIGYIKMLRKSHLRSHHSVLFDSIQVDGDKARVVAMRIAPDLRSHKDPTGDLRNWADGTFTYTARKTDSAWSISSLVYEER